MDATGMRLSRDIPLSQSRYSGEPFKTTAATRSSLGLTFASVFFAISATLRAAPPRSPPPDGLTGDHTRHYTTRSFQWVARNFYGYPLTPRVPIARIRLLGATVAPTKRGSRRLVPARPRGTSKETGESDV